MQYLAKVPDLEANRMRVVKGVCSWTARAAGWTALGLLALMLMGCDGDTGGRVKGPLLLIVVVDSSYSAQRENQAWREMFPTLVKNHLPDNAHVAFVRCDSKPMATKAIKWTGFKDSREDIEKAFAESWRPRVCGTSARGDELQCGTDPLGAFQQAVAYAVKPENEGLERKLIIAWTDLQPDPCRAGRQVKRFSDPLRHKWDSEQTGNIEVVIHGLPLEKQEPLRAAWGGSFKRLSMHMPGDPVDIRAHYGLKPEGGI